MVRSPIIAGVSRGVFTILDNDDEDYDVVEENNEGVDNILVKIWNNITFRFIAPLLRLGNERQLTPEDLFPLAYPDSSTGVYNAFHHYWCHEVSKAGKTRKPSLTKALFMAFGYPFVSVGWLKLIHDTLLFVGPLILNRLIYFLDDPTQPVSVGYWCVFALFVSSCIQSLCLRTYFWWTFRVGMRLRSAVVASVFLKSLVLSNDVFSRRSTGEISNLMSVDSTRLQDLTGYLHAIWYSFYQIGWALYFLWQQLNVSSLTGIAIIIVFIPITSAITKYLKSLQKRISSIRDERIKLTNEIFQGIKIIKFQGNHSFTRRTSTHSLTQSS